MKSTDYACEVLRYAFLGVRPSFDADATLELALHTADPGAPGTAVTNEATYPGYGRVAVDRSRDGWVVEDQVAQNAALVRWPTCAGDVRTRERVTHWSVVRPGGGAARVLYRGKFKAPIDLRMNIRPEVEPGQLVIEEE